MGKLTAKHVREVVEPGRYYDGDAGLFLLVKPSGAKSYVQRLVILGRRQDLGLGSTKWVTLTEARSAAQENRKIARLGGDPLAGKRKPVPTFSEAAEAVIAIHAETWKGAGRGAAQWRASLRDYAVPRLGTMPVSKITTADVLAVLVPIWNTKRETAKRVRQRIGTVMKWAIAEGHREDNPAGEAIGAALPRAGKTVRHQRALAHAEVASALDKVRRSEERVAVKLAFEFLVLTAARSVEVRLARWDEIDLDASIWVVPADRMKTKREHRVPLSETAVRVLREAETVADGSGLVFPPAKGRALSAATLSKLMLELGIDAVPHGFRSSFRDWCAEATNVEPAVAEAALAHTVRNQVEAAYNRTDLFEKRRALMERWARYLAGEGAAVVPLRRAGR